MSGHGHRHTAPRATPDGPIVVDGVIFELAPNTGPARVWRSHFEEWLISGFARRVLLLDRGGTGPYLPGLPTRSIPPCITARTARTSNPRCSSK